MAQKICRGDAQNVKQVTRFTISAGSLVAGETFTLTCNLKEITYTVVAADTGSIVLENLLALIADSGRPAEFGEAVFTHTVPDLFMDATAATAGVPFTITASDTSAATSFTASTTTASKGAMHYDDPDNWSPVASVPVDGDDIVFPADCPPIRYGIAQGVGVTPASVRILCPTVGLPDRSDNGAESYVEYRDKTLQYLACADVQIGDPTVTIELVRAHFVNSATVVIDAGGGATNDTSGPPIRLTSGTGSTGLTVNVNAGSVGIAPRPGDVAKVAAIRIGTQNIDQAAGGQDEDSNVVIGDGVSAIAVAVQNSGTVSCRSAVTSLKLDGGRWMQLKGAVPTFEANRGTLDYRGNGTLGGTGGALFRDEAILDLSGSNVPFTLTNGSFYGGSPFIDPQKRTRNMGDGSTTVVINLDHESYIASNLGRRSELTIK